VRRTGVVGKCVAAIRAALDAAPAGRDPFAKRTRRASFAKRTQRSAFAPIVGLALPLLVVAVAFIMADSALNRRISATAAAKARPERKPIEERPLPKLRAVRVAGAYIAMMERPDALKVRLVGSDAQGYRPFFEGAGLKCWDDANPGRDGALFDIVFAGGDVGADRGDPAVAVCGRRADGRLHGELVAYRHGIGWLLDWLRERVGRPDWPQPIRIALQGRGAPVSSIAELLNAIDGVEVVEVAGRDLGGYCGRMWDAVAASAQGDEKSDATPLMHLPQPILDLAANTAVTRPMGDGAWAWDRAKSREDISPLVALTMAHGLETAIPAADEPKRKPTAYASRGVRTV